MPIGGTAGIQVNPKTGGTGPPGLIGHIGHSRIDGDRATTSAPTCTTYVSSTEKEPRVMRNPHRATTPSSTPDTFFHSLFQGHTWYRYLSTCSGARHLAVPRISKDAVCKKTQTQETRHRWSGTSGCVHAPEIQTSRDQMTRGGNGGYLSSPSMECYPR